MLTLLKLEEEEEDEEERHLLHCHLHLPARVLCHGHALALALSPLERAAAKAPRGLLELAAIPKGRPGRQSKYQAEADCF